MSIQLPFPQSRTAAVFVISLALTACGTPRYIQPTSGPIASYSVRNWSDGDLFTLNFEDATQCHNALQGVGLVPGATKETNIEAGKLRAVLVIRNNWATRELHQCIATATWLPVDQHRYQISVADTLNGCSVRLLDITQDPNGVAVPVVYRRGTPPIGFTNIWCAELTAAQRDELLKQD